MNMFTAFFIYCREKSDRSGDEQGTEGDIYGMVAKRDSRGMHCFGSYGGHTLRTAGVGWRDLGE